MMAAHKTVGGRPMGLRCMVWVIGSVFVMMCIQLWVYERKWSEHHPEELEKHSFKSLLEVNSSAGSTDGLDDNSEHMQMRVVDESSTLREILDAVSICAADPSGEIQADTAECLEKLFTEYPALRTLQQSSHLEESSSQQRISDKILIDALENQIATLSQMLESSSEFLSLKDTREPGLTDTDRNWFMSSIKSSGEKTGYPESLEFPSAISGGRLLCFMGHDTGDGTKNKYGFAWKGYLPRGSILLPGLTLVADNYWDYQNIWHGMSALVNFVSWRAQQSCVVPARVLLFHWGELVPSMSSWMHNLLHAAFGKRLEVEKLDHGGEGPVCLERAVVNRRGLGGMSTPNMNSMFETIRCRARKFCALEPPQVTGMLEPSINVTLLVRSGARALSNITGATNVLSTECGKLGNCNLEVTSVANLTFCEQVALMTRTDILVSTHGAQLTNMMFMSNGGYVMELMPKGWLEFAGVGQYIYTWLADWTNLKHQGIWRDTEGPDCPYPASEIQKCFLFYKDINVLHNDTHLAEWTSEVLKKVQLSKLESAKEGQSKAESVVGGCTCDQTDDLEHASKVNNENSTYL